MLERADPSCGDYPALGKVLNQEIGNSYNGCYKTQCILAMRDTYVANRMTWTGARMFLPENHPYRYM